MNNKIGAMTYKEQQTSVGCTYYLLVGLSYVAIVLFLPLSIFQIILIVKEYERAVILRLGLMESKPKGPGMFCIIPCTDQIVLRDMREISFDIPAQEILTKDSVTVRVDAVVYYRIFDPILSVKAISNAPQATLLSAQTSLRDTLGNATLAEILAHADKIQNEVSRIVDRITDPWGIKITRVDIKDVRLRADVQRHYAAEAEANREARAKIISAEGELRASEAIKEASDIINTSPAALQLRYLQTLQTIAAQKNSTVIVPIPMEILQKAAAR